MIGIVTDPVFRLHDPGPWHPESPMRLAAVEEAIDNLESRYAAVQPRPAMRDELLLVHKPRYVDMILNSRVTDTVYLDPDTAVSPHSLEAALKAVGGVLEAVDQVLVGKIKRAFCAVRPPGHHAEPDRAMGFCIFNNIAIGAARAISQHGLKRIAIVDWDLHHGNGTQKAFYESNRVLYISLHQYPYYPGTGAASDKGMGEGDGYTINIPMPAGSTDGDYRRAFNDVVVPELTGFKPELLFISAGFDAHRADPLGGISLSTEFFGEMTRMLVDVADRFCNGHIISVLEGGYDLTALRDSVALHLKELDK